MKKPHLRLVDNNDYEDVELDIYGYKQYDHTIFWTHEPETQDFGSRNRETRLPDLKGKIVGIKEIDNIDHDCKHENVSIGAPNNEFICSNIRCKKILIPHWTVK